MSDNQTMTINDIKNEGKSFSDLIPNRSTEVKVKLENKVCLLDGKYLAKCVQQGMYDDVNIFETPTGQRFSRKGRDGLEIYNGGYYTFEDVKDQLEKVSN